MTITEYKITHNGEPVKLDPSKKMPRSGKKINNPALERAEKLLKLLRDKQS